MPTSQFKIYTSSDIGFPAVFNGGVTSSYICGVAGTLITILDACLVNGYGTGSNYKAPAGWLKPFPNTSSVACYQQPSGSKCTLVINDMGHAGAKEAWACGWESLSELSASRYSFGISDLSQSVGTGNNQFPDSILNPYTLGHVTIRKAPSSNTYGRDWILIADEYTFYFFCNADSDFQNPNIYYLFWFGDYYSFEGDKNSLRCMIWGRLFDNTNVGTGTSWVAWADNFEADMVPGGTSNGGNVPITYFPTSALYRVRKLGTSGSFGTATKASKIRELSYSLNTYAYDGISLTFNGYYCNGVLGAVPNPLNADYPVSPFYISDTDEYTMLGRFRGVWFACFNASNMSQFSTFQGKNGKTFMVILKVGYGYRNYSTGAQYGANGVYLIEISNTVETN